MGTEIDDVQKIAGLTEEARKRAAATPLPGALSEAFLADAIKVTDELYVRRIVASDWGILQWLDSPIHKLILEIQKDEKIREAVNYTDEEEWEMVWQFTHEPKEIRALKVKGREVFKETCANEIGDKYALNVTKMAVEAISEQIIKSFETKIDYGTAESKKKIAESQPEKALTV